MLTNYLGEIRSVRFPYFNTQTRSVEYKTRPCLIIGKENDEQRCDITVLPISKVTNRSRVHPDWDIQTLKSAYPLLSLNADESYIRCSKIYTVHSSEISKTPISSLKLLYPDLLESIKETTLSFVNKSLTEL